MPNFEAAVKLLPKDPDAHFHYAEALLKLGRKEEAIARLTEALRLNPRHDGAKYWLEQATAPSTAPATAPTTVPTTIPTTAPASAPTGPSAVPAAAPANKSGQ
jgi:tetratricopeptide (TPR) repeat protein